MNFLELGKDISLYMAKPKSTMVIFGIKNTDAVKCFLQDADFIRFLSDKDNQDDNSGCGLLINENGSYLVFKRIINTYTRQEDAWMDLLSSLKTYVIPEGSDGDSAHPACEQWCLITSAEDSVRLTPKEIPVKRCARGTMLVCRDDVSEIDYAPPGLSLR